MDNPIEKKVEKDIVNIDKKTLGFFLFVIAVAVLIIYFLVSGSGGSNNTVDLTPIEGSTFLSTGDQVLTDDDGKPYVVLFSTTWCSHCQWIKDTFDSLENEPFADQINLQHWDLDTGNSPLTLETETQVPANMRAIYQRYNPAGSIPTFVFGGKYIRIGNGYESQNNLQAETEDFRFIIGKLLEEN